MLAKFDSGCSDDGFRSETTLCWYFLRVNMSDLEWTWILVLSIRHHVQWESLLLRLRLWWHRPEGRETGLWTGAFCERVGRSLWVFLSLFLGWFELDLIQAVLIFDALVACMLWLWRLLVVACRETGLVGCCKLFWCQHVLVKSSCAKVHTYLLARVSLMV